MTTVLRAAVVACLVTAAAGATGKVTRPDGAEIAYSIREGAGPALILVPGSWGDHRVFDAFVRSLPPSLRVIVVELRGHGASGPADLQPTMARLADDVLSVADALGLRRFYIGGHSIGGMLAIEIAGRRPESVAGAIPMEGWTHHRVLAQAFGSDLDPTLTPEQRQIDLANRERVRSRLNEAEIAAFGSVWRQWDGLPILETTPVPVLSIWGDRGRPRPSRALLRLPERPNLELIWMPGASHSLLVQCPEQAAGATAAFIARIEARKMFAVPRLLRPDGPADFTALPRLPAATIRIYRGVEAVTGFNMHPYIAWFEGRFWAIWSSNRIRDLQPGQYVRYATSEDGVHWSESAPIQESEPDFRSFARGLWVRDGELIALAARDEPVRPLFGPGLTLRGYRWDAGERRWGTPFLVAADAINNFPPRRLASGEWMMSRRDHRMRVSMLIGGARSVNDWTSVSLPAADDGASLDEPMWWTLPGGRLSAAFRDGSRSRRLYRSFSDDQGRSWTAPARTDFPDATAKFNVLRLSSGLYAMASCPNPAGKRNVLALSLSRDGVVFDRMAVLRDAPTVYRYGGKDPGYAGYHYPQLLEQGEFLYVIHAENMEDIVLLRIRLEDIGRLAR
ncbi:MAG: alpha/beta fold hydrolase [Bryobacterales bacterium]|nr:alpha/beta fold hydrolase [Bryobacterales bacterium]